MSLDQTISPDGKVGIAAPSTSTTPEPLAAAQPAATNRNGGKRNPGRIVVAGGGMVAHRFAEQMTQLSPDGEWSMVVLGDEPQKPYDRVHLSELFAGKSTEQLYLNPQVWDDPRIELRVGEHVDTIDRANHTVITRSGVAEPYDNLVLATGSWAWHPRAEGAELPGVFSYRTVNDLDAIREWVNLRADKLQRPLGGVVVGGGVLGLEAAAALHNMSVNTTVVEFADRLMGVQLDEGGAENLRVLIKDMGLQVRTSTAAKRFLPGGDGAVHDVELSDDTTLPVDIVIFSTGIRPRDGLAREAGLAVAERGGVIVGASCRSSDPTIWAIGECASYDGSCAGLIAPGNDMADTVADRLLGGKKIHNREPEGTKLKGVGIDAASFGDVNGLTPGALDVVFSDPVAKTYKKLVLSDDAKTLLGGVFVGDIALYSQMRPFVGRQLKADPSAYLAPEGGGVDMSDDLPDDVTICSCSNVSAGVIRDAVNTQGCHSVGEVKACTKAGTVCGSCVPMLTKIVNAELEKSGIEVSHALCEHFDMSRAELYKAVHDAGLKSFSDIVAEFGTGRGCNICRPTVASILASQQHGHILEGEAGSLQDTNDFVMANLQKNGTYSVIPAMAGGEVSAEQLIVFSEVARDFGLYIRVTGSQRLGMFGARLEQLPEIWRRLNEAGFESGHAYGKSLRMVKTCVGKTWCRYGVQDSTGMAVHLEHRYRGLRSPHKIKMGVSGCARECAESMAKDFGIISTERGWNLYVGGNGGSNPRHGDLFAEDLDDDRLQQVIDRLMILYVREADRLQRTARWVEERPGGIPELRKVILEDSLGIGAELEAEMAEHVASYSDEWADTLADPEQLKRFVSFVNAPEMIDPDIRFAPERGQVRPATGNDEVWNTDAAQVRALEIVEVTR